MSVCDSNFTFTAKPTAPSYTINAKPTASYSINAKPTASYSINAKPTASYSINAKPTATYTIVEDPCECILCLLTEHEYIIQEEDGRGLRVEGAL